jgi:N4-gp56 family major capsid protein
MAAEDYPSVVSSYYTGAADLNSVQTAYDRLLYFALRPEFYFDQIADVSPSAGTKGNTVQFTLWDDLAVASAPLNESIDVGAVPLSDSVVSVTLSEYGNAVLTTAKARNGSFADVDSGAANVVGHNAGISLDTLAVNTLVAGSNVGYGGNATARNTVGPDDTLSADNVRRILARFRGLHVMPFRNGYYRAFVHPDQSFDLRTETGAAAWREPHNNVDTGEIYNGSIGYFEGFEFIEAPRSKVFADAGSSTTLTDVYAALFVGQQALAKAYSTTESAAFPQVVRGPITDKLQRFHPIGWYWLGGYGIFRQDALYRLETSSSIGAN